MNPIWTRLQNETSKAFQAFEIYRDMGHDRSIQKVGERLAKNPVALARLSKKYDWVKRANAFDAHVGELKARDMAKDIIEMKRRQALQAQSFQEIALLPLNEMMDRVAGKTSYYFDEDLTKLDTTALVEFILKCFKMYKEAAKIECSARETGGETTEPVSKTGDASILIANPELVNLINELIDKKIDEVVIKKPIDDEMSEKHDAQLQDAAIPTKERTDSSEGRSSRPTFLKRRTPEMKEISFPD